MRKISKMEIVTILSVIVLNVNRLNLSFFFKKKKHRLGVKELAQHILLLQRPETQAPGKSNSFVLQEHLCTHNKNNKNLRRQKI